MQLIGMLDSPYVRRVAIALRLLELPFEHRPLSVFSTFDEFALVNPVVKAPTLVCDDGTVLMDSGLIVEHLEDVAGRRLRPAGTAALRVTGLALAACEKTVQSMYERHLRPAEKRHGPWLDRVGRQLAGAYAGLDAALAGVAPPADEREVTLDALTAAVAWTFTRLRRDDVGPLPEFPTLAAYVAAVEALPAFAAVPPDDGVTLSARC